MEYFIHIKNITKNEKSYGCYIIASDAKMVYSKINIVDSDNPRKDELKLLIDSIDSLPKACKKVTITSDSIYMIHSFKSHDKLTKQQRNPHTQTQNLDLIETIKSKMYKYTAFTNIRIINKEDMVFDAVETLIKGSIENYITESFETKSQDELMKLLENISDKLTNKPLVSVPKPPVKSNTEEPKFVDIPIEDESKEPAKIDYGNDSKPSSVNEVVITPEYQKVFDLIEFGGSFIFVTGNAGTGKSVLIHQIQKKFYRKQIAVCAPTGLAALNIGGATIHSTFGLPARMLDEEYMKKMNIKDVVDVVRAINILIIDEISMVRCDLLDAIDIIFKRAMGNNELFGGKIVIGVGDLFQLPPVVTDDDDVILKTMGYKTGFFFSAKCIRAMNYDIIELKHIYRQKDETFKKLLNKLRIGEDIDFVVNKINERYNMPGGEGGVTLATTNAIVDTTNKVELDKIKSDSRIYTATQTGVFLDDKNARKPSPELLELKLGAKVMFVQNNPAKGYVNGTLGIITSMGHDSITVESEDGRSIDVTVATWESIEYKFNKQTNTLDVMVNGVYKQFPLILAWAITIHKSQGKTLSKIRLDLGRGAFAPGQLYVALSRIKTFEGLSVKNVVRHKDVIVSYDVVNYYTRKNIQ